MCFFPKRKSTPGRSMFNSKLTSAPFKSFTQFPYFTNSGSYLLASEKSNGIKPVDCAHY